MKIVQSVLPVESVLLLENKKYDFIDSFAGKIIDIDNTITIQKVGKAFFTSSPKWVDKLFTFRNKIVSIFGLKTSGKITDRKTQLDNFDCEEGQQLGLFKVFSCTTNEVIFGEDDKHLNFRVSLFMENHDEDTRQKTVTISTTVEFNNWFGKLYFLPVRPFHKVIVPVMLRGIIEELEKV
jgi:Protein of unknown function (DUF2867)